jgi:hypothetical protein
VRKDVTERGKDVKKKERELRVGKDIKRKRKGNEKVREGTESGKRS